MTAIVITEKEFDRLFAETLQKLELEELRKRQSLTPEQVQLIHDMRRAFHYEVCQLKDKLRSAV